MGDPNYVRTTRRRNQLNQHGWMRKPLISDDPGVILTTDGTRYRVGEHGELRKYAVTTEVPNGGNHTSG